LRYRLGQQKADHPKRQWPQWQRRAAGSKRWKRFDPVARKPETRTTKGNKMAEDFETNVVIGASREAARNGYGQNGDRSASSVTNPAKAPKIAGGFSPDVFVPKENSQVRPISNAQKVATTFGHKAQPHAVQIQNALSRQGSSIRKS
jgi:hypothetical protein